MIKKIKDNKFLKIVTGVIKAIISIIIILVVAVILVQRVTNNKFNLGGYGLYTVVTTSMVPKYNVGDMILAKQVDTNTIKVGDDVVYLGEVDSYKDKIVTHQVINIEETTEGRIFHTGTWRYGEWCIPGSFSCGPGSDHLAGEITGHWSKGCNKESIKR